jgi:hypothetical protein
MNKSSRIRQGLFDRWYIFHPDDDLRAWSGSRWVPSTPEGLAAGGIQIANFSTESEAHDYWNRKTSPAKK